MASKKDTEKKPLDAGSRVARICGMMAGAVDHLQKLQQELLDISARCTAILEEMEHHPQLGEEDRKAIDKLKKTCEGRFDTILAETRILEAIKKKV